MKLIPFCFLILLGCTSKAPDSSIDHLGALQEVWNSRNPGVALKKIPGLSKVEETELHESYSTDEKIYLFSLVIYVTKANKKIFSIVAPANKGEEVPSSLIKSKLHAADWKSYEHPPEGVDYIRIDVSEYSEDLGVGFAYDKLDKQKNVRMIYWGVDPKKIRQIL